VDFRQLRQFCAIVELGSFRKAADRLHISPPALSLAIKRLETELGVALLERRPGRVRATAFGHSLFSSARRIDAEMQSALDQLNALRGIGSGRLAVGVLPYGIQSAMGRLIGRFCDRYPELEVQVALGSFSFLAPRLNEGELDFLVTEVTDSTTGLHQEPLLRLRYSIVAGHGHPLAGKRNLRLRQVLDYRLAYARSWQVVIANWEETFAKEGLTPPGSAIGEATDEFFVELISNCNTVAVLPMIGAIREAIDAGKLAELHVPTADWSSTVGLVYREIEALSPDARLLLDETRTTVAALQP
jgi:LysR family transcriptional regulator of abg operon